MKKTPLILVIFLLILVSLIFWWSSTRVQENISIKQTSNNSFPTKSFSKINIVANNVKSNQIPIIVALKKGFFEKYNIEPNIEEVLKNSLQPLTAGKSDVILQTPNITLAAAIEGSPISWVSTFNNNNNWVIVSTKSNQNIKSMGVLSGLDRVNSLGLLNLLRIDPNDIQFQEISDTQTKLLAFKEKQIDSIGVAKTEWLIFKKKYNLSDQYQIILDSSINEKAALPMIVVMRNDFIKNNQIPAQNFIKALIEANFWIKNKDNKEELTKIFSEYYQNMPLEDAAIYTDLYQTTLPGLNIIPNSEKGEEVLKVLTGINPKAKEYNIKDFISTEITSALKESGFIDQFSF